jgi:serine/threonine-protein kinase
VGYLLATRVVYPAPPPPADLVEVPDVRGFGSSAAARRLEAAGLILGVVDSLQHPALGRDLVMGQSPLPGQLALPGSEVRLTVTLASRGRPLPDVTRVDAAGARQILETAGFLVSVDSVDSELPRGRVVSTRPAPETAVNVPSEVRLAVSRGPALVLMPYLIGMDEARALALLDSAGLVVGAVDYVSAAGEDRGLVVGHEPAADTPLERGSAVRLAVGRAGG